MPESKEVNADTEVLDIANDPDETEVDDLDEEVIPPVDEEAEIAPEATPIENDEAPETEPEAIPESSSEEATPVAQPVTPLVPALSKQPAPVAGETPREKALRLEVQRVKGLLRKDGIQDIVGTKPASTQPKAVTDRLAKLRENYSEEDIRKAEELIDVVAESKGYVKAEHTYQQTVNNIVGNFIEANPEYKPENDPEDVRWNRFQDILKSGIYNVSGKTQEELRIIFNKVHKDVTEELGEPVIKTQVKEQAAQRQKIKSVSHSGGTKPAPVKPVKTIDPTVRNMFKGFDDDDFAE